MGSGGGHNRWLPVRAPGVAMLCGYRRSWLRGDLVAGGRTARQSRFPWPAETAN
jgi:hypothetical protein